MPSKTFDTIVIGSGTSAYYCINALKEAGQKIAVIDERPYGGTCALRGCQPKKYLVANAEARAMAGHLENTGLTAAPQTDWPALQALKNEFLDGVSEGEVEEFEKAGIANFFGKATLSGPNSVDVNGERLEAKHIVLATGASPRRTDIPGAEHAKDSERFLNLPILPKRILFVGGGYISFEFAHVANQAGAEVTILHRSDRVLKAFDPYIVDTLLEASKDSDINVVLNESPTQIDKVEDHYHVSGKSGSLYETDLVIEASGRLPNLSVLEGDHGNVAHSRRGVEVNEFLQSTSNPSVYAIGDCADSSFQLATVADEEGKVAGANIVSGNQRTPDLDVVPTAVFTIPSLAAVGLTEAQATEQGIPFRVNKGTTTGWPSSKRIGEKHSAYKVLINTVDNTFVGAHFARHNASEVINIFALAIKHGIKAAQLAEFP